MLRDELEFKAIVPQLNRWFLSHLKDRDAGVLVSHNTVTDIQFLCCEYLRAETEMPAKIKLGLDTCATLKRFSSVCYRKVNPEDWPQLTKTGKLSMGVKPCAIYALGKRNPPETFEDVCGSHHDADADTRAVATILYDQEQFGNKGLHSCVFLSNKRCFQPLKQVWFAMRVKMLEPVLKFDSLPPGWVSAPSEDPTNDVSSSSRSLPVGVNEVREKTFCPPASQRGEGQPSPKLRRHLNINSSRRGGSQFKATEMMLISGSSLRKAHGPCGRCRCPVAWPSSRNARSSRPPSA